MKNFDRYTVYIINHCTCCQRVVHFLQKENISCEVLNVDQGDINPPIDLLIFPALIKGKQVMAYGVNDIVGTLSNGVHCD